jgi:sulfur carrier protein
MEPVECHQIECLINGVPQSIDESLSLEAVLKHLGYDPTAIAVAVEGEFVPRGQYPSKTLKKGQIVDIVAPMQGG